MSAKWTDDGTRVGGITPSAAKWNEPLISAEIWGDEILTNPQWLRPPVRDRFGRFIRMAYHHRGVLRYAGYKAWVEAEVNRRWPGVRLNWEVRGETVAEVSNASWRVKCPYCPGAQVVQPGEPFVCVECINVANDGYALAVTWPDDETREWIERILLARPAPHNMNWLASKGETVDTLIAENLEHGFPPEIGV